MSGWFADPARQLQEIAAQGSKLDSPVAQLVQAMATYAANNPGFDPTAVFQKAPTIPRCKAPSRPAWHH